MNRQCSKELEQAQKNSAEEFREKIETIRKVLAAAERDAQTGIISKEFVDKYISRIFVTIDDDAIAMEIKVFTGEMTSRYLEKLKVRSGRTFEKRIESYQRSMK